MRFSTSIKTKTKNQNILIVLAAGQGNRMVPSPDFSAEDGNAGTASVLNRTKSGGGMNGKQPKMLIPLLDRPLLYWSLSNLEKCSAIDAILLTAPKNEREVFDKKIKEWRFKKVLAVMEGGKERQDSVLAALHYLPPDAEWVGIHDAARVFVSAELVKKCFDFAKKTGAAILAVPSKDTIKISNGKKSIQTTVPRSRCWAAQTPQVFHRTFLRRMEKYLKRHSSSTMLYTDDASVAEKIGAKVTLVPSSYENIKITTPEDLILAEAILKKKSPLPIPLRPSKSPFFPLYERGKKGDWERGEFTGEGGGESENPSKC